MQFTTQRRSGGTDNITPDELLLDIERGRLGVNSDVNIHDMQEYEAERKSVEGSRAVRRYGERWDEHMPQKWYDTLVARNKYTGISEIADDGTGSRFLLSVGKSRSDNDGFRFLQLNARENFYRFTNSRQEFELDQLKGMRIPNGDMPRWITFSKEGLPNIKGEIIVSDNFRLLYRMKGKLDTGGIMTGCGIYWATCCRMKNVIQMNCGILFRNNSAD
jgi:hypothetical protein